MRFQHHRRAMWETAATDSITARTIRHSRGCPRPSRYTTCTSCCLRSMQSLEVSVVPTYACQRTAMPVLWPCSQDFSIAEAAPTAGLESGASGWASARLRSGGSLLRDERAVMHGVTSGGLAADGPHRRQSVRAPADRTVPGSIASGVVQCLRGSWRSSSR